MRPFVLAAVVLFLGIPRASVAQADKPQMAQAPLPPAEATQNTWLYRQMWFWEREGYYAISDELKKAGEEGWELVSLADIQAHYVERGMKSPDPEHCLLATFKKPGPRKR